MISSDRQITTKDEVARLADPAANELLRGAVDLVKRELLDDLGRVARTQPSRSCYDAHSETFQERDQIALLLGRQGFWRAGITIRVGLLLPG